MKAPAFLRAALTVAALALASHAQAAPVNSMLRFSAPKTAAASTPPLQFALFCMNNPADCKSGGKSRLTMTDALSSKLERVNKEVNRQIAFRSDRSDVWSANVTKGDCEDYVLTKRRRLMQLGVSPSALRIAVVRNSKGEGHAILVVKTDKGEMVLDNARDRIVQSRSTGYKWISMSSANPQKWVRF